MQVKFVASSLELRLALLVVSYLSLAWHQIECHELSRYKRSDPTTTTTPKPATPAKSNKAFEAECLRQHNKWRKLHRASPLKIDPNLVKFAQQRAEHIAASDGAEFKHPDDLDLGENLAWHSDSTSSCAKLIKMWYDEVKLYSYKEAAFSHEAGHFTQLVWRDTKRVGCARAFSSGPRGGVYLVCNYDPAGNWRGEFKENVKPAKKKSAKKPKNKNKKQQQQQQQDNEASTTSAPTTTPTISTSTPTSTTTSTTPTRKPANSTS